MRTVVGITGASGTTYGIGLLKALPGHKTVILSEDGMHVARIEMNLDRKDIEALADCHNDNADLAAPVASGSSRFDNVIIAPCSVSTMSKIACGISDTLITRVASIALKERRKLVLLVRETPLSTIHLENMHRLSAAGAVIMPASPAFYPNPETVDDMVDFLVGRILDVLDIENSLYKRWEGE
ncbi:MAG: UbiX family flavin prenyltransferase [Thermoplasmata archaeon]|nr:UbiX family flavin prenyltransferase [Thermoplasmata archaeon]